MGKILSIIILLIVATSCKDKNTAKPILTVGIEPQRYLLEKIVGNNFLVKTFIPNGTSPETFEPTTVKMIEVEKSLMYFKIGLLGVENEWTKKLSKTNPNINIVDCSKGITLEKETDDIDSKDEEHNHYNSDPHIWSSTENAIKIAKNMLDALISYDEKQKLYYQANFEKLKTHILNVDSIIKKRLENIKSKSFIIYHPALTYFAKEYNLKQYSLELNGKSPSINQMKSILDSAKKHNIKHIFIQKEFDSKNIKILAKDIDAKIYEINPLSYEWDKELLRIANILSSNE